MQSVANLFKNTSKAEEVLKKETFIPATALVIAADVMTAGNCFSWEMETLLEELGDKNCLPAAAARDRLLGGIACLLNPAFLWSAESFMAVAQTFSGNIAVPEIWEPLSPAALIYTMEELNSLYSYYNNTKRLDPLYNEDTKIYIAGCCFDYGFSELPKKLHICREQFSRFYDYALDPATVLTNPVQERKHLEIDAYLTVMSKLRNSTLSQLKKDTPS
jgi:hypothetical protein